METEPGEHDVYYLLCPPASEWKQERLGITKVTPGDDFGFTGFEMCGCAIWVGPKLMEKKQQLGNRAKLLCFECGIVLAGPDIKNIQNAGGKSARIDTTFGTFQQDNP